MKYRILAWFFLPLAAMAQQRSNIFEAIPTTTDSATGEVRLLELKANGANYFSFKAPDVLVGNVSVIPFLSLPGSTQCVTLSATGQLATAACGGGVSSVTAGPSGAVTVSPTTGAAVVDIDPVYVPGKTASNAWTGVNDFSGQISGKPMKTGTSLPATCTVGDYFFRTNATAGSNTFACTSTNVWTLQGGGGGSDTPAANVNITSATATVSCSATTIQVTPDQNYILSSAPTIANGADGQVCEIWNLSTSRSLMLADLSTISGTNIYANDRQVVVIPPTGSTRLRFSSSLGGWIESKPSAPSVFSYQDFNDFCLPTNGWTIGSFGGVGTNQASLCTASIEHNAVFGSGAMFQLPFLPGSDFLVSAKSRFRIQQSANTGFRWGLYDGNGYASPSNGVYVEKLPADASVHGVCISGGVSTRTPLATADGSQHIYSITRVSPTSVVFFMDSATATVTTNCPASLDGYRQGYQFGVSDATIRVMQIDWTKVVIPR